MLGLCLLTLLGCQSDSPTDWQTLDFGPFSLKAPPDWRKETYPPTASYIGGLSNGRTFLVFDYGLSGIRYANWFRQAHGQINVLVDGRPGLLLEPRVRQTDAFMLYVYVDSVTDFTLSGMATDDNDVATIRRIFTSVRFTKP